MRRREFIAALTGFACAVPWTAQAQKGNPTVGVFLTTRGLENAFQQGLADFGYVAGQNILLVLKDGAGAPDQINQRAAELVAVKPDVIFGGGSQTTTALKRQTRSIPIVTMSTNPVGLGFVASLARPEGNVTGVSPLGPEVAGKRLELLKEIIPDADTAAVFWNPEDPGAKFSLAETQTATKALKIDLHPFETRTATDIDTAFSAAKKEAVDAVILLPAPFMGTNARRIAELAIANRLYLRFRQRRGAGGPITRVRSRHTRNSA
jgi:putative tryptophan/tyrosine transport system substrate-binding protein